MIADSRRCYYVYASLQVNVSKIKHKATRFAEYIPRGLSPINRDKEISINHWSLYGMHRLVRL